jgi:hypothetical protein
MTAWQRTAIALARSRFAKTVTQPVIGRTLLARRFVACGTAEAAVAAAHSLHSQLGITASLFHLGEYIDDPAQAEETVRESCRAAVLLREAGLDVHVTRRRDLAGLGTSWSQVSMPDPSMAVAGGTSGSDVWFMGATTPWHFDDSSFTQVPGPVSHEIVAISPSDAWGVASVNGIAALNHWNGSVWSTVKTLPASDGLFGLAALSANDMWAVGSVTLANGNEATLTMRWNGSTWSTVSSPNPAQSSFPSLIGAAAAAPSTVFAAGQGGGIFRQRNPSDGDQQRLSQSPEAVRAWRPGPRAPLAAPA